MRMISGYSSVGDLKFRWNIFGNRQEITVEIRKVRFDAD
jgi:hypothetical protein